jgi:hypothetical protein
VNRRELDGHECRFFGMGKCCFSGSEHRGKPVPGKMGKHPCDKCPTFTSIWTTDGFIAQVDTQRNS